MAGNIPWEGLLKWSLQYTDGTSAAQPRSREDIEFLQNAVKDWLASCPNPHEILKESVQMLNSEKSEEVLSALAAIDECIFLEPEIARDMAKMNVIPKLSACIARPETMIVEKTLDIFNSILPHNPALQSVSFDAGVLDLLMAGLKAQMSNPSELEGVSRLKGKYMSCVSGLVRHDERNTKEFIHSKDGLSLVMDCLTSNDEKCIVRSSVFVTQLLVDDCINVEEFQKRQIIPVVTNVLQTTPIPQTEYSQKSETVCHLAAQVAGFIASHKSAIPESQQQAFITTLSTRSEEMKKLMEQESSKDRLYIFENEYLIIQTSLSNFHQLNYNI